MSQPAGLSFDSEHRLRSENLAWDIDVWYPKLKDFTFPSIFLPLKLSEAKAIKAFNDVSWRNYQSELLPIEIETLNELENDITKTLEAWEHFTEHGVFMRLCGRSPKDGENRPKFATFQYD
jgi:hypothetical protein